MPAHLELVGTGDCAGNFCPCPAKFLPTGYEPGFFFNSMSFGDFKPFVHPTLKTGYWKQSISISATVVFDIVGGTNSEPDTVDTTSHITNDQTIKFTAIQVMGFGTVFKAIGINPATAVTTVQRQYKNQRLLDADPRIVNRNAPLSLDAPPGFSSSYASSEIERDTFEVRGMSARWVRGYTATAPKA